MANMRIVMLTHAENEYYSALYPLNANNEIYKGQQNGFLNTSHSKFYFDTFKDQLTGNIFFVVINTDYNYKDIFAEQFISQLKSKLVLISASKEGLLIEHGFLNKEATNEIKTLFEKYKKINRNGELEINNNISKENVKEEGVIMDNSQNEKMNEKENKRKSDIRIIGKRGLTGIKRNQLKDNVFMKDSFELEKVHSWKLLKIVMLSIFLACGLTLYIAVPFLIKYKRNNFNEDDYI